MNTFFVCCETTDFSLVFVLFCLFLYSSLLCGVIILHGHSDQIATKCGSCYVVSCICARLSFEIIPFRLLWCPQRMHHRDSEESSTANMEKTKRERAGACPVLSMPSSLNLPLTSMLPTTATGRVLTCDRSCHKSH